MTQTHKDRDGATVCNNCGSVVTWLQSAAGKWYLANGKKGLLNTSTRFEKSSEIVVTPESKVPHFKSCEYLAVINERREKAEA
jgi:hypothetical protein